MRDALRQLSPEKYWVYGPTVSEFSAVVEFVQRQCDNNLHATEALVAQHRTAEDPTGASSEAADDLLYYAYLEREMLWSFALWRLQGMFEALIVKEYGRSTTRRSLLGLKAKLEAVRSSGFTIDAAAEVELLGWARLRNLLSHTPAEHYRPISLDRQDIEEYRQLLESVCSSLCEQANAGDGNGA